ncbi:MAG: glycosyltransferase family 4 protein [Verrucomicrobiota bacterium]
MRILIVYPYVPYPVNRGTYHRVFNLAKELGQRHEIDLFCLDDSQSEAHRLVFEAFARRVHFQPFQNAPWPRLFPERLLQPTPTTILHWRDPAAAAALRDFAANESYDLIHFCDLVMWQYVDPLRAQMRSKPLLVMDRSRVDLLFQTEELANLRLGLKERCLRHENLWKLRRYENSTAASLTATVVCGPDDETFLRRNVPTARTIKVLANGVDEQFFSRDEFPPRPDPEPTVLFCGAMDYSPNVSGLAWYFENCDAPLRQQIPNRRVLIVGRNPAPQVRAFAQIEGVTVTGEVADVRPYYQRAWVQMVPLLIGGGTRLKIVESLALGTPVVSTTIGAQGLALENGEHLLLGDSPTEFAAVLDRMLSDDPLRQRLAEAGRQRVLERYTWGMLGGELSAYYEELFNASKSSPQP